MFAGTINGTPAVRVSADDNVAPWDLLPTDYGITRVNTDIVEIGYAFRGRFGPTFDVVLSDMFAVPSLTTWLNYPLGSSDDERECLFLVERDGNRRRYYLRWGLESAKPVIAFWRKDRSNWTRNWVNYRHNARERYVTYSDSLVSVYDNGNGQIELRYTDASASIGQQLSSGPIIAYYDYGSWWLASASTYGPSAYYNASQASGQVVTHTRPAILETELPLNGDPYPAVTGTPAADKTILRITNARAAMAKPGFDLADATADQLIFDSDRIPIKVAKTGFFTIGPGAQIDIDVDYPITPNATVHEQINETGDTELLIPPYPSSNIAEMNLQHRIVGQQLQWRNQSSVSLDCRYFVSPEQPERTVGSAPVLERIEGGHYQLRAPGTAGTSDGDIIIDTRCAYLPIVKQDYVPYENLRDTSSDRNFYSTHMHDVSWANDGSWKPFVLAAMAYGVGSTVFYQHFVAKRLNHYNYMGHSTFLARLEDTRCRFYFNPVALSRWEDAWDAGSNTTAVVQGYQAALGLRYYILAVPNSL